jgi:hypothetical protein
MQPVGSHPEPVESSSQHHTPLPLFEDDFEYHPAAWASGFPLVIFFGSST